MTANEYPYGLNETRAPVPVWPGDRFDTPAGLLTVSIDAAGGCYFTDQAGAVVPVYLATFRYRAHYRADGRQVWPTQNEVSS